MEEGTTNRSMHRYAKLMKGSWCSQFVYGSNPWLARYVYGVMFLFATLLAWALRDYGHKVLREFERFKGCEDGKECLGTEGVLRVSLGCFIFYFVMFLSTVGTSKLHEPREIWQSGWWSAKIVLMIGLMVVPFFLPAVVIKYYGIVAHFGAGVFLLIQLISIISFITWLNDCCHSDKYGKKCRIHVILAATSAYTICIVGIVFMYIWYAPDPACILNIFFITLTLLLLQLMASISRHPKVDIGFLTPGFMGLYVVFLCWSAIRSEPAGGKCLKKSENATNGDWLSIISFVVAILAMVIATFSTGIDSKCIQFRKEKKETKSEDDDVPYGFGFFHFIFATGAMYFAMLFIGWNTHRTLKKWTIDVGWTSTWVRIVNEWLAACIYIWRVLSPIVWENRQATQTV